MLAKGVPFVAEAGSTNSVGEVDEGLLIDRPHPLAALEESAHEVPADEPARSGH